MHGNLSYFFYTGVLYDPFDTKLYSEVIIVVASGPAHYGDVIMGTMASQTTSRTIVYIVYSTVYSGADQRKHQSSASLAFCGEFTGDR